MKQTNESGGTWEALDSLVRHWLVRLAALYDCELSSVVYTIWTETLMDQSLDVLAPAFRKLERTFKPTAAAPFPVPAHLLDLITSARAAAIADEAESAWQSLLEQVQRQYHPDLGWKGPSLDPRIDHAARAAGGVHWIWECSEGDLVWCKKRFIECCLRDEQLAEDHVLLSGLPGIFPLIESVAEKKSLKPARPITPSISGDPILCVGARRIEPSLPMTDEQIDARKKLLREQAEKTMRKAQTHTGEL
jgi:hypothetical protein